MFSSVISAAICGIKAEIVHVEADVSDGLPSFMMVGYLSSQVKEAQERVKTAMKNSGIRLNPKRITVNLSPADLRKDGAGFDLPIAVAVLVSYGYIPQECVQKVLIAGELSLNGEVCGIRGILPMVRRAKEKGYDRCIVPKKNAGEGAVVDGIEVYGVENLQEVVEYLNDLCVLTPAKTDLEMLRKREAFRGLEDFKNINGQEGVRRAAEVAVAGMHNLLLIGPPGAGKSMVAKCISGILPQMSLEESLELSEIYSVAGLLKEEEPLVLQRPFRAPHHTVSAQALAGGGRIPRPGEVSLAHRGVLFLDELPEFQKRALEILRQPMEDRQVVISRMYGTFVFPANCMVVAAMNPCKCGFYPDLHKCSCTPSEIHRYIGKISRPLLDRMDLSVEAPAVAYDQLASGACNESSAEIRKRVEKAQLIQQERYENSMYHFNSDLDAEGVKLFCPLQEQENRILEQAFEKLRLSARAYHRIIKVSRTIADLEGSSRINSYHIAEAICYRNVEDKFWT